MAVAPEAQAVDSEIGEPLVPNFRRDVGHRAEQEALDDSREIRAHAQQVVIGDFVVAAGLGADLEPLRPIHFDRRHGQEQGARKIALLPMPDWRWPLRRPVSAKVSDSAAAQTLRRQDIDRAGDAGLETVGGKRVMARMPDSPAVSLAQLSVLPAPSEVTTPRPVTTTIGRPILSFR